MTSRALVCVLFVGVALGATPAAADVISESEDQCRDKDEGDRCRIDRLPGHCAASTCLANDYTHGTPPRQIEMPCLVCERGRSQTVPTTTGGCGRARIDEPSTAIGSSVLGLVLAGLAWRRRAMRREP